MTTSQPTATAEAPESTRTVYVVQRWIERYEFWGDCTSKPAESMFDMSKVGWEVRADGEQQLTALREEYPGETYRLIDRTTSETVLA